MDIRGNTFSIEASPVRKGQPLFLFQYLYYSQLNSSSFYVKSTITLFYHKKKDLAYILLHINVFDFTPHIFLTPRNICRSPVTHL